MNRRNFACLAVLTAATLITAAFPAAAAPTVRLAGRATTVQLAPGFLTALQTLQVTPAPLGLAFLEDATAFFPIASGALDAANAKGEIIHFGGLKLTAGTTVVELSDFIIDTTAATGARLTGDVVANGSVVGRIPLFDLQLPALALPLQPGGRFNRTVEISGVGVTLAAEAATALNGVFNVTAFVPGLSIGTAQVTAIIRNNRSPAYQFRPD